MYKNIAISLLGAWVLRDVFGTTEVREQIAIVMGLALCFLFFAFFARISWKNYGKSRKESGNWSKSWKN